MGGCLSDVKGGQQAIGGGGGGGGSQQQSGAATSDAVDFFYRTKGDEALFTQLEVPLLIFYTTLIIKPDQDFWNPYLVIKYSASGFEHITLQIIKEPIYIYHSTKYNHILKKCLSGTILRVVPVCTRL